jgi:inositol 1,4,5-triphosphate receptor type 1/inositol 1,4,5-triphosphate receptor type 3
VTEYTGIESYIAEKLRNFDNSWFPINKALGLQNMTLDSHHYEAEKLKEIEVEMNKVKKNIADII